MRVSPDTLGFDGIAWEFAHTGGYAYADTSIAAFSHIRLVGAGVNDLGNLGLLPIPSAFTNVCALPKSCPLEFTHEGEIAEPGYYAVSMSGGIRAELTASGFTALHRYTPGGANMEQKNSNNEPFFQPSSSPVMTVRVDPSHSLSKPGSVKNSSLVFDGNRTLSGWLHQEGDFSGRFGGFDLYYVIIFPINPQRFATWSNGTIDWGQTTIQGQIAGFAAEFPVSAGALDIIVGISFISVRDAQLNILAELQPSIHRKFLEKSNEKMAGDEKMREKDIKDDYVSSLLNELKAGPGIFDQVRSQTGSLWKSVLQKITVNDANASEDDKAKLSSALYRVFTAPTQYKEPGRNVYLGFDNKVHQNLAADRFYYSDLSIWDIHRTQFPLLGLLAPDVAADILQSLVLMYEQGGDIPRWPLLNGYIFL